MGALTVKTAAAVEPILLAEAKLHRRIDIDVEDNLITGQLKAVRERVEQLISRRLINQTLTWTLDRFPFGRELRIPVAPVSAINSVKYKDEDGTQFTFSTDSYLADTVSTPSRVVLKSGSSWPIPNVSLKEINAIEIEFVVGYGTSGASVPQGLIEAILLLTGVLYENREEVLPVELHKLPSGARTYLEQYDWDPFKAVKVNPEVDSAW